LILFNKFTLPNGLRVLHHLDSGSQLCALNILYDVGAKDEDPEKTGFAHLFEHLMFAGSENVSDFDAELQKVGGENNAFTNNDFTNYYITLPANNIETAFWLESDRMLALSMTEEALEVQRQVVIEEFKERYLNQPYGDSWLNLLPLAYTAHPYRWPTIGRDISHIENARLEDVRAFFSSYYCPSNAILVIAGNIESGHAELLANKWFGDIPAGSRPIRNYAVEPEQMSARTLTMQGSVPLHAILKAYHVPGRLDKSYYALDLLSDIIGNGKSSRLYQSLVKSRKLFVEIDCYLSGDIEPGLMVIEGKLTPGILPQDADKAIEDELAALAGITPAELTKVKNKSETQVRFNDLGVLNKAMKLAYCELLGDPELANTETNGYQAVELQQVLELASTLLRPEKCSTLIYLNGSYAGS
jgi:predicted Zn-dependent peptidase